MIKPPRIRRGRRPMPGIREGVSAQAALMVKQAQEAVATCENKLFAEMYATSLERRVYHNDPHLFNFMKRLLHAPVGIEEFLDGPEYLGATDIVLWPEVRKAIIAINGRWWQGMKHDAVAEAVLMGSTSCVDGETEFLTPTGWKRIENYEEGDYVAQYHIDGTASFVQPDRYIAAPARGFYSLQSRATDQRLTSGHRVVYRSPKTGRLLELPIDAVADAHNASTYGWWGSLVGAFILNSTTELPLSDVQIRIMVAVMADGCFANRDISHNRYCTIRVKREYKKSRIVSLLTEAGIDYNYYECDDGYAQISFRAPRKEKHYTCFWWGASTRQLRIIVEEAVRWDGNMKDVFRTTIKKSAEFIQYASTATGTRCNISVAVREDKGHTEYRVGYLAHPTFTMHSSSKTECAYQESTDEQCYCFTVPSSMWVARRSGKVFVTGNSGKSEICKITTLYHLYLLSCIDTPQALYGLPKTTSIVFVILAAKPHVTKKVLYAPMRRIIETTPYFQKHLRPNKLVESEMIFEEQNIRVVPGGADAETVLGEAIIGGIIDEINFMNVVLKSKRAEVTSGRAGLYDQAHTIHSTVVRRKKGRFISQGPVIGVVCTSSSTRYKGDFTDKRKALVLRNDEKNVYIYDKPQYEVWPQDRYCGEKFRMLVGNEFNGDTRILKPGEKTPEGSMILHIPIEYLSDFQSDPFSALRDVCGISSGSISPFFRRRFKIYEACDLGEEAGLVSFLEKDSVILGVDGMPSVIPGHYCLNPSRPRYVHIDLSTTGDRCVAQGQSVLMADGRYVPIEYVRVGDTVVTHEGGYEEVTNVFDNGVKEVLDVGVYGWPDALRATATHSVWAVRRESVSYADGRIVKPSDAMFSGRSSKAAKERYNYAPEFIELGSLRPGDFLVTPRRETQTISNICGIPLTYETGYIAGLFAAEGSFYHHHGTEYVQFSLHENEVRIRNNLEEYLRDNFGVGLGVCRDKKSKGVTLRIRKSDALVAFLLAAVGEYSHEKHLDCASIGTAMFHAGVAHGYVDGDGHVRYDESGSPIHFRIKSVSKKMATSFYWLLVSNGFTPSMGTDAAYVDKQGVPHRTCHRVSLSGRESLKAFTTWNAQTIDVPCSQILALSDYLLSPIVSMASGGDSRVFDLTVGDTHSYIVGNTAVHNCGIGMVRFDGMVDVTRNGGIIEKLPIASVELACSIEPDANNELQFSEVRTWVKQLRDVYGYPIKAVTYDGIFSVESIQQWRKQGMKTGHVSVDKTSIPYKQLRDTFHDGRLRMFRAEVLIEELFDLEYDEVKDKIDHPAHSSKDVADSVCGAYYSMLMRRASWSSAAMDDEAVALNGRVEFDDRLETGTRL